MYRDNGIDIGYEDAIPVKRSKRSLRTRDESRRKTTEIMGETVFSVSRSDNTVVGEKPTEKSFDGRDVQSTSTNKKRIIHGKNQPDTGRGRITRSIPGDNGTARAADGSVRSLRTVTAEKNRPIVHSEADERIQMRGARSLHNDRRNMPSGASVSFTRVARVPEREPVKKKLTVGTIVRRSLLSVGTALALVIVAVFGACYTVAHGPSVTVRNTLVLSALQASATKWVPGLFLDSEVVDQILADSYKVSKDVISVDDYISGQDNDSVDKWANAIDGMIYEEISGPTFKGYVLLIKDPKRVTVGVAADSFTDDTVGLTIFDMTKKYGSVAAINGGEYPDNGGFGIGGRPIGLTYSDGKCVWADGLKRTFMGFDSNDRLIVREGLTKKEADELGIRDGVCFQTGNTLITNDNNEITIHYAGNNTGTAQRTAIGQAVDGTVILLVTDGRTASSLGATHNDVIDVMISYGAVSAGMLDGGSSTLMYYKDYYDKYDIDKSLLDEYQKQGLVNKYKAFTTPRRLPTCFIVAAE